MVVVQRHKPGVVDGIGGVGRTLEDLPPQNTDLSMNEEWACQVRNRDGHDLLGSIIHHQEPMVLVKTEIGRRVEKGERE